MTTLHVSRRLQDWGVALPGSFAAVLACYAWATGDMMATALIVTAALAPLMIYAGVQSLLWRQSFGFVAAIALIAVLCSTFRVREITDKSIDLQIVLRLAALAGMAGMSIVAIVKGKLGNFNFVLAIWCLFAVYGVITSFYSLTPAISFVESSSGLIGFLFLLSLRQILGFEGMTRVLIIAAWILCGFSIVAYLVNPSLGRMADWVNGAFVPTARLTGVFGTSNAAGAAAAMGMLLTILLSNLSWRRPQFFVVVAPMLFCLVLSNNRMAMFAVFLALLYAFIMKGSSAIKILCVLLFAGVAALILILFGDSILESLSRSGSADEITSGTGRTRIWAVVFDLWLQRPVFGYGEGSARLILPVHPLLFKAAAHAHSLYFNVLFSGGLIGFALLATGMVSSLGKAIMERAHALIALFIFQFFYGLTEPTIGSLVSYPSLSFYAVMVLIGTYTRSGQRMASSDPPGSTTVDARPSHPLPSMASASASYRS